MYWIIRNAITGNTDSLDENYKSESEALEVIAEWEAFDKEHGEYIPDQYIAEPLGRAESFAEAIRVLASKPEALDNLENYLHWNFGPWLKKYANTPDGLTNELVAFAEMF